MALHSNTTNPTLYTLHGPVCRTCGARRHAGHTCSRADLVRRLTELHGALAALDKVPADPTRGCPCRPENGGSGICGCVLGGPRITCGVV